MSKTVLFALLFEAAAFSMFNIISADDMPTCQPKDFHYEYTECDSKGGRWRVSVPKPGICKGGAPNAPVRGKDCTYTCEAGEFLDIQGDQDCHPCPAGTYSLGGGVRFDDFTQLPNGFTINTEPFTTFGFLSGDEDEDDKNCTSGGWHPKGNVMSSLKGRCSSSLIYTIDLVRPGSVRFDYQFSSDVGTMFHFMVQNTMCQAYGDEESDKWPQPTAEGEWKTVRVSLKSGMNVLVWKTIGITDEQASKPVMVKDIEISGVAYTSECTKCKEGSYSGEKATVCTECPQNKYSGRGAGDCTACDTKTQYSEKGSASCKEKPACTSMDYYEYQTPCDNKKTRKMYKWVEPQICRTDMEGATQLPEPGPLGDCPSCNAGMQYTVNGSNCVFCPENHFSDGAGPCKPCPVSTSPSYGYDYTWWYSMPPNVTSACMTLSEDDCVTDSRWMPSGDHIRTIYSRGEEAYIVLNMDIPGFRKQGGKEKRGNIEYGVVEFLFELSCSGDCAFVFLSDESGRNLIVSDWSGTQEKMAYKYYVHSPDHLVLTWAFQRSDPEADEDGEEKQVQDFAKIYQIKVTNTIGGGASSCEKCPQGTEKNGCIPCPDGQYIDKEKVKCVKCPENTIVPTGNKWGVESCKPCGLGLHTTNGRDCVSDCKYTDSSGKMYDFTQLKGFQYLEGSRLFTASGTQYFHGFNMSLCGTAPNSELATCQNNITHEHGKEMDQAHHAERTASIHYIHSSDKVSAFVCKSTVLPSRDMSSGSVSSQPVSLGDILTKIVVNESLGSLYESGGFSAKAMAKDVHFFYQSDAPTGACPEGRKTIISLRCNGKQEGLGKLVLPPKCADGTCDGCTFHFLWKSEYACPICRKQDLNQITGECLNGHQTIHYSVPPSCRLADVNQELTKNQTCKVKFAAFPYPVKIAIPVIVGVGILMFILLIYCWRRNKKLEYRYMKLVENSSGREGELPGVDSCALEDDEDEQIDRVEFKRNRPGQGFFKKLTGKLGSKQEDENPFESVKLQEKMPLT